MGRTTRLVLLGVFLAGAANAATPSAPFTAVNNDGRPMTGATVTVTDSLGMPAYVFTDPAGSIAYSKVVPSTGIVQFFGEPKTYIVTVSGSGTTRQFYVDIPSGEGGGGLTKEDFPGEGLLWKRGPNTPWNTLKVQLSSTVPPTVNDDLTQHYIPGSIWVDVIGAKSYMCLSEADGAAVWKEITNAAASGGGSGNIANGTTNFQVPFWVSTQWLPSSGLWTNGTAVGVGPQGIIDPNANLQISKNTGSPSLLLWNSSTNVVSGNELGKVEFGALDSTTPPRRGAQIVSRAVGTWGPQDQLAPTSLDFRVQSGLGTDTLGLNALRIVGQSVAGGNLVKVLVGTGISETTNTVAPTWLSTQGIDIFDGNGGKAISIVTPLGLSANKTWTLPTTNGSSGMALTTDGSATNAQLSWTTVAPGLHAATHAQGGTDEVASYQKIYDETTLLPQRRELAFTGAGVTCTDIAGKTSCAIASGAGGGLTSLNGDTSATQTFTTGTTGADFNIVSSGSGLHTFALPNADFNVRGVVSTGTQTFAGVKYFLTGLQTDGNVVLNNTGSPGNNLQVKSDTNNNAIFVDSTNNSVGVMTGVPNGVAGYAPSSFSVVGLAGKNAITAIAGSGGSSGVIGVSNTGATSAGVAGIGEGTGSSGIVGQSIGAGAYAAHFLRNVSATVPIVLVEQQNSGDSQPLMTLKGGIGLYQITGNDGFGTTWGIDAFGKYMSNLQGEGNPAFAASLPGDSNGLYFTFGTKYPGLTVEGDSGLYIEAVDQRQPNTQITGRLITHSNQLPDITYYLSEFSHDGGGNGVKIDNSTSLANTIGLYVLGGKDYGSAVASRFDAHVGIAVDGRQTGSATGSSTAPVISATREVVLTGGAVLSGPLFKGVDNSNTTGRLLDLQRPANTSKFYVSNDGSTGIDNSTGTSTSTGLTVIGPNAGSPSRAALFTMTMGTVMDLQQTGVASGSSFDPVLKLTKNMTFSSGLSSGPLIIGSDNTTGGIGDMINLTANGGIKFRVDHFGETTIAGISTDGTGKVVCVKADGNLGTCTAVVNSSGVCSCA